MGQAEQGGRYTFGDSGVAATRLALLAEVLADSSRDFLGAAAPGRPQTAVDLGCGPGFSTALIGAVTGARETVGLDRSAAFVDAAQQAFPTLRFVRHDVTGTPLPVPHPDLIFARLLLAHLPEPARTARAWARCLAPGGRLLLEEMEWIDTDDPVLAAYEERVLAVVTDQGAPMYAGPLLAPVGVGDGLHRVATDVCTVAVPTPVAARIYALNLAGWRHDPYAVAHYRSEDLDQLAARLAERAVNGDGRVRWGVRQLVLQRGD